MTFTGNATDDQQVYHGLVHQRFQFHQEILMLMVTEILSMPCLADFMQSTQKT